GSGHRAAAREPGSGRALRRGRSLGGRAGDRAGPPRAGAHRPRGSRGAHVKILIAEDDTIIRRLLEVTLSRSGYEVVAVSNGRQALGELLKPDAPRLAVLDWMMPEIDGLDV